MAITPTVLIAAQGMMGGGGIGVNPDMTAAMSAATSNPISTGLSALQGSEGTVPGLSTVLNSLPSAITSAPAAASAVTAQASSMVPDVKTFISLHSGAASFGSASAEYSAALTQFGDKSFGDLGVGMKSFTDTNSMGLTSAIPGLGALAAKAKTDAFGSIGPLLDPAALAKGQAQLASSSLKSGLDSVSGGIKNFGTLFDFKSPASLNPNGLISSLQKQGLADSTGINDQISAAGYDPKNIMAVPAGVLTNILSNIQGSDLQKIIKQTGAAPVGNVTSAADLLHVENILPAGAASALGLSGSGMAGLSDLGNTFKNLGVPMDVASASNLLSGAQTKIGQYLGSLETLIPTSVKSALSPMLGTGGGPFGNPTMNDMMGSLSGVHTDSFKAVGAQLGSVASSPVGQGLSSAMSALQAAITSGIGVSAALTALQSATATFNAQAVGNSQLAGALSTANGALSATTAQISKENSNLSLAGIDLGSPPSASGGMTQIMGFAAKLHGFGVDKLQVGHNDMFNGAATADLTGDAIKASLNEGKSIAQAQATGMPTPTVSNTSQALSAANASNFDSVLQTYVDAKNNYNQAENNKAQLKDALKMKLAEFNANSNDPGLSQQLKDATAAYKAALAASSSAFDAMNSARDKAAQAAATAPSSSGALDKYEAAIHG